MFGDWLRIKWVGFGAVYGLVAACTSIILTALLLPFMPPDVTTTLQSYDPVSSIFGEVADSLVIPLAGICLFGIIVLSSVIGMISWYLNSWALTASNLTPMRFITKSLNPYLQMVYAGMIIPTLLVIATIILSITGEIATPIDYTGMAITYAVNLGWVMVIIFLVSVGYKIVGWKLPTYSKK